jgi:translation initiation factor 2A
MPAKTTIFNFRGVPKHNFPLAPRNTIQFSPHGRFVLVAGFGNLAGQMDLYDMDKNYHKITTVEASNASVCAWSPDGQYILTATTSPRLRVDNGVRIWHLSGNLMYNEEMTELYDVTWRPQTIDQHPLGEPLTKLPVPHPSATAYMGTRKAPVKPAGAYRPPGARGQLTPLAFKREDEGGAAFVREGVPGASMNGFGKPRRREIPGAEPSEEYLPPGAAPGGGVALPTENLSKSAAKNKKKREAAKKAKEDGVDATPANAPANAPTGPSPDRRNRNKNTPNGNGAAKAASASAPVAAAPVAASAPAPAPVEDPSAQDKKIRGLLKKIRAIDELKMRLAGGEKLEDTQMKKIQTEDAVRKELSGVGYDG